MTTVAERLQSDDTGVVWLIDVSFNDFASVAYRWSTASVNYGGADYDGRIASMTPITRSFGLDHLPAASTVKIRVSNADYGADWLIDRSTVATQLLQARFRLTALLYQGSAYAAADTLTADSQVIGFFSCLNQPEMMDAAIDITLADDSLGRLAEPLSTPTVRDWKDTNGAIDVNPLGFNGPTPGMDWDVPLPLVFGLGEFGVQVPAYNAARQFEAFLGPIVDVVKGTTVPVKFPIVVCVAKNLNNTFQPPETEISRLWGTYKGDIGGRTDFRGTTVEIPRKFQARASSGQLYGPSIDIWRPRRSNPITKAGRQWQIVWIEFSVDGYHEWFKSAFSPLSYTQGGANTAANEAVPIGAGTGDFIGAGAAQKDRVALMAAFDSFMCNGSPLSAVTQRNVDGGQVASRRLVDFIYDAIVYYSKASIADMDTQAWVRAAAARTQVMGAGIIQPSRPRPLQNQDRYGWVSPNPRDGIIGVLRSALGDMCASCDADLFMTKGGLYSIATNVFDFAAITGSRVDITESRTSRVRIRMPSQGERWAPYNRVMLIGPGGASYGPYDNQAAIDAWGTILPVTLNGKWSNGLVAQLTAFGASSIWQNRNLESMVRPAIRFVADREYMGLELGDYFTFTYSRGGGFLGSAAFDQTLFRLEGQRIDPTTGAVELDAVWVDDMRIDRPAFLLDDETFLVRWSGSGGGSIGVLDGSTIMTITGGGFITQNVQPGDILVLKDSTQAADVFTRYRKLRIDLVEGDDTIDVVDADLDFDAPGGASVAAGDWYVERGATTYPNGGDDPVAYPSNSEMYGKASDAAFLYSDSTAANPLKDG